MNDYSGWAGAGFGVMIFGILLYLGILALSLWIGYLLMRTAVKNGVLLAFRETGQLPPSGYRPPGGYPPGYAGGHPGGQHPGNPANPGGYPPPPAPPTT